MKIAYLILAHNNPRLLKRAIDRLSSEDSGFFLHIDRKADIGPFSAIGGKNVHFCEPRLSIHWGEFSIVEATLKLIDQALRHADRYDFLVLLSGSDYPLRSAHYIQSFLESHPESQFINLATIPTPGFPLSKINKLSYPSHMPVRRLASRLLGRIGLARRNFAAQFHGMEPCCGSQWWTISRPAADYISTFVKSSPTFERFFQNTFTADEMFFQTILGNSPFRSAIRRNLTYLDWPAPGNHPRLLGQEHADLFSRSDAVWLDDEWGAGEALFARKFSDDHLELLDQIDEMIERKDGAAVRLY
jgi:hypothetical protein